MADASDSKSLGKPCGFESHHRHFIIKQLRIERFWAVFLFLLSFLYFGVFWEDIDDCIRRGHLTGEIQMGINVAGCADVAMAQVVETDALHLVRYEEVRKMLAQEIGPNPFSHRVYIDIVKIIGAIASAADLPILLLLFLHLFEHLLTGRDQGKRPAARLCFCLISCDLC